MAFARIIGVVITILVLALAPVAAMATSDLSTTTPEQATAPTDVAGPAMADDSANAPHEAAVDHGEGGLPQLNIATYPSQIFWLLVMFAVLYIAFSKSILPSIGSVIDTRESLIKGNLDQAESFRRQAENIKTDYESSLERARSDAGRAILQVEEEAKAKASAKMDEFRRRADADMKNAETRVLGAKEKAMSDITGVAAEVAVAAAEKITGQPHDRMHAHGIVQDIAGQTRKAKAA